MPKSLIEMLREGPEKITREIEGKQPEQVRDYLKSMAAVFVNLSFGVGASDFHFEDRRRIMEYILDNYARTFPDVTEGYLQAFRDTGVFPGARDLPLQYATDHLPLEVVSFNYTPSRDNVAVLLKKYSPKQIADAYASRRMKYEAVSALVDNGLTLKDLRAAGIKITGELREKIFGQ